MSPCSEISPESFGSGCPRPRGWVGTYLGVASTSEGTWRPGSCHHLGKKAGGGVPTGWRVRSWLRSASPPPSAGPGILAHSKSLGFCVLPFPCEHIFYSSVGNIHVSFGVLFLKLNLNSYFHSLQHSHLLLGGLPQFAKLYCCC